MSKQIDERPAKFCLPNCSFMSLNVKSNVMYANNEVTEITNVVSCEHENVCAMWADREAFAKEPNKQAEWFVLTSTDADMFETKITAKCSTCGYVHKVANIDEKMQRLAPRYNARFGVMAPNEIETLLPKICPGCLSKMIFKL